MSLAFLGRAATFVGLGWAGQTFLPKEYVDRINDALRSVVPSGGAGDTDRVMRQLNILGHQVDQLSRQPGGTSSTIVVQREGGSRSYVVYGALICSMGYAYARYYLGWRLDHWFFVSRASFDATVAKFSARLESVTELVATVREVMSDKIRVVKETIDKLVNDVGGVHDDVKDVQADVDKTRALAESCDKRIAETSAKQDYANRGIHALCAVVDENLPNARRTPAIESLRAFALLAPPARTTSQQQQLDGRPENPALLDDVDRNHRIAEDVSTRASASSRVASPQG